MTIDTDDNSNHDTINGEVKRVHVYERNIPFDPFNAEFLLPLP